MQHAFREHVSAACCAHTLSNIIKSFVNKCAELWFKEECNGTIKAVGALVYAKKREGCEFSSINEEIEHHKPTITIEESEDVFVEKPLRKLEGVNWIRFR